MTPNLLYERLSLYREVNMNYILRINNQYTFQRYMYAHNFYSHRFGYSVFVTRFVVIILYYAKCDLT